ncbi:hypothetical protein SE17_13580 [Kouleothrix aurantiaca]|uniref:DinB-like domain-containing protein n=1 Tax=Kouleothrix aurantiaca TaxID=186479 RepID=A0A0P9HDQ5_9CHLR|nr:hypothetical protein SE17_13580 [Kouleothrix aurantiaca]
MTNLDAALAALAATRAELLALVGGLDEAALDRKGTLGAWSVKNALAHLAAWEEWVAGVLPERIASGATPADFRERAANEDRFNALEVAEREELTPDEQIMELERIRAELLRYLGTLPPDDLARRKPWPEWDGTVPEYLLAALDEHEREHLDALRAALQSLNTTDGGLTA